MPIQQLNVSQHLAPITLAKLTADEPNNMNQFRKMI